MAKPIEMPFEGLTYVSSRNHVLHTDKDGRIHSIQWQDGNAAFCQKTC